MFPLRQPAAWRERVRRRAVRRAALFVACWLACAPALSAMPLEADAEADRAYTQALAALKEGRWVQAELMLERTLMFNPDHAEARLELAGLLALGGREGAARALIESLIADPRTSNDHRERLRAMLARRPASPLAGLDLRPATGLTIAEVFTGWTRNPLARADLSQLTLTFPEGSIALPVDQRVRSGLIYGLAVQRIWAQGLSLEAGAQRLDGSDAGTAHRFALSGRLPAEGRPSLAPRWLLQTQRALDGNVRHTLALSTAGTSWRVSGGIFTEPDLARDGVYARIEHVRSLRPGLRGSVFAGLEHAMDGVTGYWRVGAALGWEPMPRWSVLGQAMQHRDFSGYSPWLQEGARRSMHSLDLAVERSWQPAGPEWDLLVRAHLSRRWSNLALFGYRDGGIQVTIRRRWP